MAVVPTSSLSPARSLHLVCYGILLLGGTLLPSRIAARQHDADPLRQAVQRSIDEPGSWQDLYLLVECTGEQGSRSLQILDRGVAVWSRTHQFDLTPSEIADLLRLIETRGFLDYENRYGGGPAREPGVTDPGSPAGNAMVVLCQVDLRIDGLRKSSQQLARGERFEPLYSLAGALLDASQEQGEAGVTVTSLRDGLEKVQDGTLAPEVLSLQLQRRETGPAHTETQHPAGFSLSLAGSHLEARIRSPSGEYSDPVPVVLPETDLADLLGFLLVADPDTLPTNLWAPVYTDLTIRLLDRSRSIQARPFGRLTPETHGARQQEFDALVTKLTELAERATRPSSP